MNATTEANVSEERKQWQRLIAVAEEIREAAKTRAIAKLRELSEAEGALDRIESQLDEMRKRLAEIG